MRLFQITEVDLTNAIASDEIKSKIKQNKGFLTRCHANILHYRTLKIDSILYLAYQRKQMRDHRKDVALSAVVKRKKRFNSRIRKQK